MNTVIITSFKEQTIGRAIESFKLDKSVDEIIVVAPDEETLNEAIKHDVKTFKDEGKGKSIALNMVFDEIN